MADSFVHLHVHTEYSMLDGAAKIGPLFSEVARQGMPAIGMTDHGNMFGAYEFYQQAKSNDIKPIIGIEAYIAPESRHHKKAVFWGEGNQRDTDPAGEGGDVSGGGAYTHMTMLAANPTGLRNLFKLSSLASLEGYYRKPRMDRELIAAHAEGIIATTGCPSGEVQTRLRLRQVDKALEAAATYQEIFGKENFYLELMEHGLAIERSVREGLLEIGRRLNLRPLATNDSHYVTQDQSGPHEALLCVGTGKTMDDPKRFKLDGDGYYIKSAAQMRALWDEQVPEACDSSLLIAERVESYDEVFAFHNRMPRFPVPEGETEESFFRKEVQRGLERRFPNGHDEEHARQAAYEMDVIAQMGFPSYFLVVADFIMWAKSQGIAVGPGRGSAAGSLVAYALGITDLDPLPFGLIFERFLNPERVSMPDIDVDFDDRRRADVIRYVTEKYGDDKVAQILTFGTIKAKAAIKDAARVLGYPFATSDRITKAMPPAVMGKDIPLSGVFDPEHPRYTEASEMRGLYEGDAEVKRIIDLARGLEGLTRGTGVHAAGVILSSESLIDVIPIHRRENDGAIITGFPYPQCEDMGLLKMDFLGLRNLTIMDDAVRNIEGSTGTKIDLLSLPLDDKATYELLGRGDTLGVFQLDGTAMRSLLRLLKPDNFEDIAAVNALYRPGPMGVNSHTNYALRKNGQQEITPIHPELEEPLREIVGPTYGLIVYQEQVQRAAQVLAGYSLGQADLLRRAMGKKKKEILDKEFGPFQQGMREHGYSDAAIKAVWDVLVPFAGYAFNKAHAACYAQIAYWTAYLKANYPAEYMAALLTSVGDDKDKMAVYLAECRSQQIRVLPPDVNESQLSFTPVGADVRFGLGAVRNVGENVVRSIVAARTSKGKFASFSDFLDKVDATVCNKRTIESLIKAGAFDSLGHTRKALVAAHETAVDAVLAVKRQEAIGQFDLFGGELNGDSDSTPLGVEVELGGEEWDRKHLLAEERSMLGLYVSSHPLDGAAAVLERNRDCSIAELLDSGRSEGEVRIAGIISKVDRRVNKSSGNLWAIVTVEDLDAAVEALFFPKTYPLYAEMLVEDVAVTVRGRLNERDGTISLFAQELTPLEIKTGPGQEPTVITIKNTMVKPELIRELRHVLRSYPGTAPVHLHMRGARRTVVYELPGFSVEPNGAFVADIKALLGVGAVR